MFKKIAAQSAAKSVVMGTIITTLCASSTLAHGSFFRSGFLAGAQLGASFGSGKFNTTLNINPALPNNTFPASGSVRKSAMLFGILCGYRHIFNQDYTIGFNLEANFFANNQLNKQFGYGNNPTAMINNNLKKSFNVIPSVVLGKIFCGRWHASLSLGLAIARFRQQFSTDANLDSLSGSASKTKIGFIPALGVEYATTPNVSLFGNISYEIYSKVSNTFKLNIPAINPVSYKTSISPKYLAFKVGAVYRF